MEFEIGEVVRSNISEDIIVFFKIADVGVRVLRDSKGTVYHKKDCVHLPDDSILNLIRVLEVNV